MTLEKARAKFALDRVREIEGERETQPGDESSDSGEQANNSGRRAKFKTQLLKLPARLHNTGLGQTVAYLMAQKSGTAEREILDWLTGWLQGDQARVYGGSTPLPLIDCILEAEERSGIDPEELYRRASSEARALAVWLKRFAEAFLREEAA